MKLKTLITSTVFLLVSMPLFAESILIHVNGMVCGFCAQGIDKKLRQESSVQDVKVDLGQKIVSVQTKSGQTLSDEKVTDIIKNAGFEVRSIERKK